MIAIELARDLGFDRGPIRLAPQYLKVIGERGGYPLHSFQHEILESDRPVNFVHSPVGSGKTYAFTLASHPEIGGERVLMVLPTNALIEDVREGSSEILGERGAVSVTAGRLDALQREGRMRYEALEELLGSGRLVVINPDILSYLLHGAYGSHTRTFDWMRALSSGFGFDRIVFDEYHLFDEDEFSMVIPFLLMVQMNAAIAPKFFFLSGTPLEQYIREVERIYGHKVQVISVGPGDVSNEAEGNSRLIQKGKTIYVSTNTSRISLLDALTEDRSRVKREVVDYIEKNAPVLFIFDSVADAVRFDDLLLDHFGREEVGRNTGLETRIRGGERPFSIEKMKAGRYKAVVTTSKIEVGVNYPVDNAFIESGPRPANAIQRIGRVGRGDKGKPSAEIFLLISRGAFNRYSFVRKIRRFSLGVIPAGRSVGIPYLRLASLFHFNLIFDSLKADRRSDDLRNEVARKLRLLGKDVGIPDDMVYPLTSLIERLRECGVPEDALAGLRGKISEYFLAFRPDSFTREIVLRSRRGDLLTEYDVLRALLRFKPCLEENRVVFFSQGAGIKRSDISLEVSGPLIEGTKRVPYERFRQYTLNFPKLALKWGRDNDHVAAGCREVEEFIRDYLITLNIRSECISSIIRDYLPLFSPPRIKIIDVLVPLGKLIC
ncbi:MAG: type I-D CRISPR-associated helicase Cas3' [Candidatus Korarchaeota archaeon]|nr:type I-D CRISPR-associated helicase Cas3' [Candidatus Korarchaeota archaeon]